MKCFYCVAESVSEDDPYFEHDDKVALAITNYEGTPVCADHAIQLWQGTRMHKRYLEFNKWHEEMDEIQEQLEHEDDDDCALDVGDMRQ